MKKKFVSKEKVSDKKQKSNEIQGVYNRIEYLQELNKLILCSIERYRKTSNQLKREKLYSEIVSSIPVVVESLNKLFFDTIYPQKNNWNRDDSLHKDTSILDHFKNWFNDLYSIILNTSELIRKMRRYESECCNNELELILCLSNDILANSLVIKNQPRVLNSEASFNLELIVLLPLLKVNYIIKNQGGGRNIGLFSEQSFQKCADVDIIEFTTDERDLHLNCKLKNLRLIEQNENVLAEKYIFQFGMKIEIELSDKYLIPSWIASLKTTSLPVAIFSHPSQEANACSNILWDEMHRKYKGSEFFLKNEVFWSDFEETLNSLFMWVTGRTLSAENMKFIYEKWFKTTKGDDQNNLVFSRTELFQSREPNGLFTHWEWLYAALKLIRDHLRKPWIDGRIIGFISKIEAKKILHDHPLPEDLFLLRFSETTLGTISSIRKNRSSFEFNPITREDFKQPKSSKDVSIGQIIKDMNTLSHVYCSDGKIIRKKYAFKYKNENIKLRNEHEVLGNNLDTTSKNQRASSEDGSNGDRNTLRVNPGNSTAFVSTEIVPTCPTLEEINS